MLNLLVENALDFLSKAISEIKESPKFSIIHFYAAVELFIKARLMAEHWSLVIAKRQDPDWDKFISGDFQSVSLDEAASRLTKIVRSGLSTQEHQAFREIAKHRNKMVHFFHEAHTEKDTDKIIRTIVKQQLFAWYFLHKLIINKWKAVFEPWKNEIMVLDKALRKHHGFLNIVFDQVKLEIGKKKDRGCVFEICPSCGFESQEHEDDFDLVYESKCLVCELVEKHLKIKCPACEGIVIFENEGFATCDSCDKSFEPNDVVGVLLDHDAAHISMADGDDSWDLGNCSNCDSHHTVVRQDDGTYICASCFEEFDSLNNCHWCNEPNTYSMEYSYYSGCNMCDGKAE